MESSATADQPRGDGDVMDLLIAATAILHELTLVTHNVEDFASVPGLAVVDWLAT
jgi:tRNA(fMet)-specific endonuclease VapC